MTQVQKLELVLYSSRQVQMDYEFEVEVIDEQTGLVEETINLPVGEYVVYQNYDLDEVGKIRRFIEDPNTSFNRLLRLAKQE